MEERDTTVQPLKSPKPSVVPAEQPAAASHIILLPGAEEDEDDDDDDDILNNDEDISESNDMVPDDITAVFTGSDKEHAPPISRRLSRNDADSIVGGESFTSQKAQGKPGQKIFSFQLPFGNSLSSIRTGLASQIHFPNFLRNRNNSDVDTEALENELRLKLERQESLNTISEATYFQHVKVRDDVRLRAVKHSLTNKYNDFLPDFIHNSAPQEAYDSIYSRITGNIVVLGGYRGSILRDSVTHKRVWIPIKAGFHLRKINLLLGPNPEDEVNATKYMYPDGVLKNIGPIDICKALLKKLSSNPKTNVKEFGYDWRLNGDLLSDQLVDFLKKIKKETGKPSLVIAHSMGGLVTHGAIQKNPELFRSVIYVGVPSECLNILGPIRFGDSVLLSDKILTAEANFMMRSSFHFLPLSGRIFFNKETNECYEMDLFDPDTWVEYNLSPLVAKNRIQGVPQGRLSPFSESSSFSSLNSISNKFKNLRNRARSPVNAETTSPATLGGLDQQTPGQATADQLSISFEEAYNYLGRTLKLIKAFILSLQYNPELEARYPPMAVVYGNTIPSVRGSHVNSEQDIRDGDYYNLFYGHGDGVVHQKLLMPAAKGFDFYDPETGHGQIIGRFPSSAGHVNLMTDLKVMGKALDAVFEAEKVWARDKRKAASKK